jgi:hypothetical protein
MGRIGPVVALSIACLFGDRSAVLGARPLPCPAGRFVPDAPLLAGGDDVLILDESGQLGQLSIGVCGPVLAHVKATRRGTKVRAVFPLCAGIAHLRVKATICRDCVRLTGWLRAATEKPRRRPFAATRSTGCGDGVLDPGRGEECEVAADCAGDVPCVGCACVPPTTTTSTTATTSTTFPGDPTQLCVDTVNGYRALLSLPPYERWTAIEGCADGQASTDSQAGMAHATSGQCGEFAQSECVGWPGPPVSMVPPCLLQMWNEGPGDFSTHGDYLNMSSATFTKIACGFTILPSGDVWAVLDFE